MCDRLPQDAAEIVFASSACTPVAPRNPAINVPMMMMLRLDLVVVLLLGLVCGPVQLTRSWFRNPCDPGDERRTASPQKRITRCENSLSPQKLGV